MIDVARPSPCWSDSDLYRKLLADPDWVAEPKIDGWRCVMEVHRKGPLFYTRRGKRMTMDEHFHKAAVDLCLPYGTVLDGEWNRPSGVDNASMVVWDVPVLEGRVFDYPLQARHRLLRELLPDLGTIRPVVRMRKGMDVLDRALRAGHEGIVLKNNDSLYPFGKTTEWVKVRG